MINLRNPSAARCASCSHFVSVKLSYVLLVGTLIGGIATEFVVTPPSALLLEGLKQQTVILEKQENLDGRVNVLEGDVHTIQQHLKLNHKKVQDGD